LEADFSRDIRPILSENCFQCHGPDEDAREGELRLDSKAGLLADRGGYHVVVPGDLEQSELHRRIRAEDPDEVMPPKDSKKQLTDHQKRLIEQWIKSGASWEETWAYKAPERPVVPAVASKDFRTRNPIDHFIARRLQEAGLAQSKPADKRILLRRVSLDLAGLPPSPEELVAFLNDSSPQAFEKVVDRLLKSERFGERWARPWLDLARYADSNGFQADQLRPSWAYRDWVIEALNSNMPFDQFTVEQLAGDLLPGATPKQKIATGFHRTVTCNVEAGVDPEQNRVNQVVDRVNTTGTVWLGSTIECAQCHDHKYDPITMQDYYRLFAFFNNTPLEVELPSGVADVSHDFVGPYMELPESAATISLADSLDRELEQLRAELKKLQTDPEKGFDAWQSQSAKHRHAAWAPVEIISFSSSGNENHRILDDGSVLLTGNVPSIATHELVAKSPLKSIAAFRLEALTHDQIPGKGPGRGDDQRPNFVLNEFQVMHLHSNSDGTKPVELFHAMADFSQEKWDVAGAIDGKLRTGWAIAPRFGEDHWASFEVDKGIRTDPNDKFKITLRQTWGRGRVLGRFRISVLETKPAFLAVREAIDAILKKPPQQRSNEDLDELLAHYWRLSPEASRLNTRIEKLQRKRDAIAPNKTLVMLELEKARTTTVMNRGNYQDPGEEVNAATPNFLHGFDADHPSNRLGLAKWLVDARNPLIARVTVNRWWAELFGRGIVATTEDFGAQSEPPTHRELLDWLAVEFVESGWDMKHLLKVMVSSETYMQESRVTEESLEADPKNILYARAPRLRLDAESIRDSALMISGLLSTKMYGKPTMPHQPPGLWNQAGRGEPVWTEQQNSDRWRRAIYIVYRRAAPYPSLVNFDAPDRAACTVKRARTNTPTQALTLLNDPSFVEMALALADRILIEAPGKDTASRISYGISLATAREAKEKEIEILTRALARRRTVLAENPKRAAMLVEGASKVYQAKHHNIEELAAWLYIGNILLNLDEVITKG
jgi:hypothetical protein